VRVRSGDANHFYGWRLRRFTIAKRRETRIRHRLKLADYTRFLLDNFPGRGDSVDDLIPRRPQLFSFQLRSCGSAARGRRLFGAENVPSATPCTTLMETHDPSGGAPACPRYSAMRTPVTCPRLGA
jgi:hypothetical protein